MGNYNRPPIQQTDVTRFMSRAVNPQDNLRRGRTRENLNENLNENISEGDEMDEY